MSKKTAFYAGITLVIQSISFAVLFLLLYSKKRSLAAVLLALSAVGGVAGGYLLYKHSKSVKEEEDLISEFLGEEVHDHGDVEILTDEEVDESEFC